MRVVMIGNGKGGVGKTSTAVNLADCAARAGWRTLLVDLDPQSTAVADFGVESDEGQALLQAFLVPAAGLVAQSTNRENLDVLAAGTSTRDLLDQIQARRNRTGDPHEFRAVRNALSLVKDDYDLVVLDTPPGDSQAVGIRVGLATADYLVIPTAPDAGSLEGLAALATAAAELRALHVTNVLTIGVLLHNLNASAKKIRADATATLVELFGDPDMVLPVFIRQTQKAAVDQRQQSLTAWEYAQKAAGAEKWWENKNAPTFSQAAGKLASDYHNASTEILNRITSYPEPEPLPGDLLAEDNLDVLVDDLLSEFDDSDLGADLAPPATTTGQAF